VRVRPALFWHRWFGIVGGVWLFLISLTGSILVFYDEFDRALNPELSNTAAAPGEPRLAAAVRGAEAIWPGTRVASIRLSRWPGDPIRVRVVDRADNPQPTGMFGREAFVDPATGRVLGHRRWGEVRFDRRHIIPMIYEFHHSLYAGETVSWLIGVLALLWLVDHFFAAPLALGSAKRWAHAVRLRKRVTGHKRAFDLHRAAGMWLLPITATLAFTGIYFNLSDGFHAVLERVTPLSDSTADSRPALPRLLEAPPVDADAALKAAREQAAAISASNLFYDPAKGLWTVAVHDPRDLTAEIGERDISVDAQTGLVIGDRHFSTGSAGDAIVAWQYPLHSGKAFGWIGRILILLAGIATCTLVVTGYMVWLRRRSARRKTAVRSGLPSLGSLAPAE